MPELADVEGFKELLARRSAGRPIRELFHFGMTG